MCSVLLRADLFLTEALSVDGSMVGADESFQYVITALADAKLHCLTTLYMIMNQVQLEDLKSSRFTFLIERLQISSQFLEGQCIPLPPIALLPFILYSPPTALHSEEPIQICGFAVWAVPTFVASPAPAKLCCTGDPMDIAHVYAYDWVDVGFLGEKLETMPTRNGTIFHVRPNATSLRNLIRIPDGDFVRALPDLGILSNLLMMKLGRFDGGFSVTLLPFFIKQFCEMWPMTTEDRAREVVVAVIRDIQNALIGRSLPRNYQPTGIVDPQLIEALRREIPAFRKEPVYIDPRIKSWICHLPRPS
jgi:hypothetical protein